jgi:hypothetical protein
MPSKPDTKLTLDDEIHLEDEFTREIYRRDLFLFAYECLGFKDLTWHCHGPMIETLEAPTTRKLIVMPRGSLKSSICSIAYPIWQLMKNPNERILID